MKKLVSLFIIIVMAFSISISYADVNLSELSYDELLFIKENFMKEIMSRPEWKSVEVPSGHWRVGEDIPEGNYSIRVPDDKGCYMRIWGADFEDWNTNGGLLYHDSLKKGQVIGKIELKKGWLVDIDSVVYFEPPRGLGF